jgi:hypothetical protein
VVAAVSKRLRTNTEASLAGVTGFVDARFAGEKHVLAQGWRLWLRRLATNHLLYHSVKNKPGDSLAKKKRLGSYRARVVAKLNNQHQDSGE